MLLGLGLLYVGAVLVLNGLWLLGHIEDREIVVVNVVSGTITLFVSLFWAFSSGANDGSIKGAALTLLFTATYFWVAYNRFSKVDGRGLGWFSLFVAITVAPVAVQSLQTATSPRYHERPRSCSRPAASGHGRIPPPLARLRVVCQHCQERWF